MIFFSSSAHFCRFADQLWAWLVGIIALRVVSQSQHYFLSCDLSKLLQYICSLPSFFLCCLDIHKHSFTSRRSGNLQSKLLQTFSWDLFSLPSLPWADWCTHQWHHHYFSLEPVWQHLCIYFSTSSFCTFCVTSCKPTALTK